MKNLQENLFYELESRKLRQNLLDAFGAETLDINNLKNNKLWPHVRRRSL